MNQPKAEKLVRNSPELCRMVMELNLSRICSRPNWSAGYLTRMDLSSPEFLCATLEDEAREVKVRGETRIAAGRYEVLLRNEGGMTGRYAQRFPEIHKGMLWLQGVPDFEYVYIHTGNTDDHTEGCILVGSAVDYATGFLGKSSIAYEYVYPLIAHELSVGNQVFITIEDVA